MLCCLSKRALALDLGSSYEESPSKTEPSPSEKVQLEPCSEDVPPILLPCAICARTFMPQSLEKHKRVCERAAAKKRKPFDSARQRIQGTDLAEFLPKQEKKRNYSDERTPNSKTSWKEKHDELLRAIRAARGDTVESPHQRQGVSTVTSGAPTRSNEQGLCPTCNRHFGIKAYDRHVAWCKERSTRVVINSATNVAKERLEARMKYRAPLSKSRRVTTREKYSPGSATVLNKSTPSGKAKESASTPNCNKSNDSLSKQKPTAVRRVGQTKESPSPTGPMKSRLADRMDRLREDELGLVSSRNTQPIKRMSYLPVPPLKPKKDVFEDRKNLILPQKYFKQHYERIDEVSEGSEISSYRSRNEENIKVSARSQKMNIVSARSKGNPKLNDVAVNAGITSMIVQPCTIYGEEQLVTWKQLSRGKRIQSDRKDSRRQPADVQFPDIRKQRDYYAGKGKVESGTTSIESMKPEELPSAKKSVREEPIENVVDASWAEDDKLNQTFSINEITLCRKSTLVKNSPRVEFCIKDIETYKPRYCERNFSVQSNANVSRSSSSADNINSSISKNTDVSFDFEKLDIDERYDEEYPAANEEESNKDGSSLCQMTPELNDEYETVSLLNKVPDDQVARSTDSCIGSLELQHETETESDTNLDSNSLSTNLLNCQNRSSTPITDPRGSYEINNVNDSVQSVQVDSVICESYSDANSKPDNIFLSNITNRGKFEMKVSEMGVQANICGCFLNRTREAFEDSEMCEICLTGRNSELKIIDEVIELTGVDETTMNDTIKVNTMDWNMDMENIDATNNTTIAINQKTSPEMDNEIQMSYINRNFNYDSDTVEEQETQLFENDLPEIPAVYNTISSEHILPDQPSGSNIKLTRRPKSTGSTEPKIQEIEADGEEKVLHSMCSLRRSTNSLNSFDDTMDIVNPKESDCSELETIEEIQTYEKSSLKRNILPEIKRTLSERHDGKAKTNPSNYWDRSVQVVQSRLINLDLPSDGEIKLFTRNPTVRTLPPVTHTPSSLIKVSGAFKDYDPFLLAEQQMNDLLSDTSDQSVIDGPSVKRNNDTLFPLSPSSAFVKYPYQNHTSPGKRTSLIAPPTEFDDLISDFSSDSTETNSLSREVFLKDLKENKELKQSLAKSPDQKSPTRELGRRVIIDKSKALGGEVAEDYANRNAKNFINNAERARKILGKVTPKVVKPTVNRSLSIRAASAPKPSVERKNLGNSPSSIKKTLQSKEDTQKTSNMNNRNNHYVGLSGSNLSLSSIMSSEVDMKRSNSVFEELMTSFEEENGPFSSLRSLLKSDSLSLSSPVHDSRQQRNGQLSDEDLSSPENYKRQDHSKHSADSAYSSLNRKYSQHGRSTSEMVGRLDEDPSRSHCRESGSSTMKSKMPKYCHDCGTKFPEHAKFCSECGLRRLAL